MQESKADIVRTLEPLFQQALENGLWFYNAHHSIWFSPGELIAEIENDKFVWGAVNWELRNPEERIEEIHQEILFQCESLHTWRMRMIKADSSQVMPIKVTINKDGMIQITPMLSKTNSKVE